MEKNMGQIILGLRASSEVETPPVGRVNIFVDIDDGLIKVKDQAGAVRQVDLGQFTGSYIKYSWNSEAQKNAQVGMANGDQGIREDLVGRPVYLWNGAWVEIFRLDGEANTTPFTIPGMPWVHTLEDVVNMMLNLSLYVKAFSGGGVYELGEGITEVNFSWEYNKDVITQSISPLVGPLDPSLRAFSLSEYLVITSDTVFTLSADDGSSERDSQTSVLFKNKRWWGTLPYASLGGDEMRELSGEFADSREKSFTFNGGGKYLWYCYPARFDNGLADPVIWINGGVYTSMTKFTVSITNLSGYTELYTMYRSNGLLYGSNFSFLLQ